MYFEIFRIKNLSQMNSICLYTIKLIVKLYVYKYLCCWYIYLLELEKECTIKSAVSFHLLAKSPPCTYLVCLEIFGAMLE